MLVSKQNIPFAFCEEFNKCVGDIFPDSATARKFSAGKTKTTQTVKGAIASSLDHAVRQQCQTQPFGLLCDDSNNAKWHKEFVLMARLYDETSQQVRTRFLDMPVCNIGNAENLFTSLSSVLR
ncbi:UNVERIFIED_CONTAM: hypothetical protein FKN15_013684 [Acipenser sinensis]